MCAVEAEIDTLRATLEEELVKKQNKSEYQALASLILALPSREESLKTIEELELSVKEAETRNADLTVELEQRTQQFQLLVFALQGLQSELGETAGSTDAPSKRKHKVKRSELEEGELEEPTSKRARNEAQ